MQWTLKHIASVGLGQKFLPGTLLRGWNGTSYSKPEKVSG